MFAGYSHMWTMAPGELRGYLGHMASIMRFTTPDLAAAVGIEVRSPFTDPELVGLALEVPYEALVGEREGRRMGKWIIRRSVEALLPPELVWRVKTPIEYGSGSTFLAPLLSGRISDEEFASACTEFLERDGLRLRDKEQLYYYRVFREAFGPVRGVSSAGSADCPYCGAPVDPPGRNYCGVCGAWGFQSRDRS
jgi:asparagine synthase (glutamine-hydrolysing)